MDHFYGRKAQEKDAIIDANVNWLINKAQIYGIWRQHIYMYMFIYIK